MSQDAEGQARSAETNQRIALFDKYMCAVLDGSAGYFLSAPNARRDADEIAEYVGELVDRRFAYAAKQGEP